MESCGPGQISATGGGIGLQFYVEDARTTRAPRSLDHNRMQPKFTLTPREAERRLARRTRFATGAKRNGA